VENKTQFLALIPLARNFSRYILRGFRSLKEIIMAQLENEVRSVVQGFLQSGELFTALDVSNKVKMVLPLARHREVRDIVRGMFTTDIEPASWARTPIQVTLPDGSAAEALLYHPLTDSWDLDSKYDDQKRAQAAVRANAVAPAPVAAPVVSQPVQAVQAVVATPPVALPAKDRWQQLFTTQPSLFPRK
jgi:hypothetical protein